MAKKAYFIGISGITMANLAIAFKKMGWEVSGSDQKDVFPPVSTMLEENNISYFRGYSEDNFSFVPDLVVVGRSALMISPNNPEYLRAKKTGCKVLSYPEVLGEYLIKNNSIVVAGTYGKSTTTALISWILINADLDPSFMIGGLPLNFSDGTRITDSAYSVVEGDETPALHEDDQPKFLYYRPKYLLLTATEYDHPEVYKSYEDYLNVYINLVKLLPNDGVFFYDPNTVDEKVVNACNCKKIAYLTNTKMKLDKKCPESSLRSVTLCNELKIDQKIIEDSITSFEGLKGRGEFLGEFGERFLYHDLSQQSSKIKRSLSALKNHHPKNKIIVIFNPSATSMKYKTGLDQYSESFDDADQVIVAKVDYISGVTKEDRVTGPDLVEAFGGSKKVFYEPISEKIIKWLTDNSTPEDVIVFMSSGGLDFMELIEEVEVKLGKLGGLGNKLKRNVFLAEYTTFKIGGPADLFVETKTEAEIVEAINFAKKKNSAYFILGNGSKILVGDKGYRGLIIKLSNYELKIAETTITAGAGVQVSDLLNKCIEESLTGLEFMAGIPATVGGATRGNAGAWQKNIGDLVIKVKIIDDDGNIKWLSKEECDFSYRDSRFKHNSEIILEVEMQMSKGDKKEIEKNISQYLEKRSGQPKELSVGCIFVNPPDTPAGMLIDQCGLKGTIIGGAKISEEHANFIVNMVGAKASDVVALINFAKEKVKEKFDIDLQEEIIRVGEF